MPFDLKDLATLRSIRGPSGPSGSVQTDWLQNDDTAPDFLKNKPFGEFKGDTLTWEFDRDSLDFDSLPGGFYVKVSDAVVTMDDLVNGTLIDLSTLGEGVIKLLPEDSGVEIADGIIMGADGLFVYISDSGVGVVIDGTIFPESGVYVTAEIFEGALTIPGFNEFIALNKMDDKYLPNICVKQTVLYLSGGMLYKDGEYQEALTYNNLIDIAFSGNRVRIRDEVIFFEGISIDLSHGAVVYAAYEENGVELRYARVPIA